MLHIPLLRRGRPYRSIDVVQVVDHRTRERIAEVSQANPGLVRRDLLAQDAMRAALDEKSAEELVGVCERAAQHFMTGTLPLGDNEQTAEDYVRQASATTGLPWVLVRRNMTKIAGVMKEMRTVLAGLTRDLDLNLLDDGMGLEDERPVSFVPRAAALGAVLPTNSPGVHAIWVPAIALKTALVLRPGSSEPWTPYRIVQALIRAGAPEDAFGYYPGGHDSAAEILRACGRSLIFGDAATTGRWRSDPRVEVHGPGYSKVLLGPDTSADWPRYVDVMVASIAENSGRSCINASGVWTTAHAPEIAQALASRLAAIEPRPADDPRAELAPFPDAALAERISEAIDQALLEPGARDLTAERRGGGRLTRKHGCTYLLPTVILCDGPDHPLANREFLFPFASVVPIAAEDVPSRLGPTLALSAITEDPRLRSRLLASPLVHRLNLGPMPTTRVAWDQPHEGNLFEHLWSRRAVQAAASP